MAGKALPVFVGIPLRDKAGNLKGWAIIDVDDAALIGRYRWCLDRDGYVVRSQRTATGIAQFKLHREILGLAPGDGLIGDHINRNKLDNRRENLRVLTPGQSPQNRSSAARSTSRFRGVSWNRERCKWHARAWVDGRNLHVGWFDDETEAGQAAAAFRAEHMPFSAEEATA